MGSCVSLHKDTAVRSRTATAANGRGSPPGGLNPMGNRVDAASGVESPGSDDNDEFFFDSRAWIESDCEDDFFSVNGDFTPSRGSTPNFQTGTPVKPQLDKAFISDGIPDTRTEPSPRKKLGEFLQETFPGEPAGNDNNAMNKKLELNGKLEANGTSKILPPKSLNGTPYHSGISCVCSGDGTPNDDYKNGKEKRGKAMKCCLPSLVHSLSVNERKKQSASPGPLNGG